ncbi:MAG: threonylcarbamoyl-AMP synthase, partial [Lachnospiraceae bacterium]|nr:threonylcarbamoyl-AMP synthase [Lachnospiraceae bacterium]
ELERLIGHIDVDKAVTQALQAGEQPRAPGMKYRHYAPNAEMMLVEGEMARVVEFINREAKEALAAGKRVGIICTEESRQFYSDGILAVIGSREHEETVAHNLFAVLRDFDDQKVDCIFSESFSKDRLGQAIMNRLCKAAGYHIVNV